MEQLEKDKSDKFSEYQSDSLFLLIGTTLYLTMLFASCLQNQTVTYTLFTPMKRVKSQTNLWM